MKRNSIVFAFLILLNFSSLTGQNLDTSKLISIFDIIKNVNQHHPVIYSSKLQIQYAKANELKAKGNFDPMINYDFKQKSFNNKSYYSNHYFEVDIFTHSPITPVFGYDNTAGSYVNPENSTFNNGLGYVGLELPVLKNLITDQRRTALKQAKIILDQSETIQNQMIQNLHQSIWGLYLQWYLNAQQREILNNTIELTFKRQQAIRQLFIHGGCSGFDTLESAVQLNQFVTKLKEFEINTEKSKIQLNAQLWNTNLESKSVSFEPLILKSEVIPTNKHFNKLESFFEAQIQLNNDSALNEIPDLKIYQQKLVQINLDIQLKKNYLLPKFDIKYHYLNNLNNNYQWNNNNQRIGLTFTTPLWLRASRGELKNSQIKFQETEFERKLKYREVEAKINALKKQTMAYKEIYEMLKKVESGYWELYQMEIKKFENGDGTIFLLNSRENKYLEAKLKTIEQYGKYMFSLTEYFRATGLIQSVLL